MAIFFLHLHVDSLTDPCRPRACPYSTKQGYAPTEPIWSKIWNNSMRCRRTVGAHHAHAWPCCVFRCSAHMGRGRQVQHDAVKRSSIFYPPMPCHLRTDASLAPVNSPLSRSAQTHSSVFSRKSPSPCFVSRNDAVSADLSEGFLFVNFIELRRPRMPHIAWAFSRISTPLLSVR